MSVEISKILERLECLERLVVETRLTDDQIVGASYVAALFDCSEDAVIRGRFGTDRIRRVREKPVGFRKGDVHRVLRELTKTPAAAAAEARAKAKTVRKSIITKKAAQK